MRFLFSCCLLCLSCAFMSAQDRVSLLHEGDLLWEMRQPSNLLEHVAGRIAHAVQTAIPEVLSIDLKLTKCNPPMGADCAGAGVEIHLINDKTRQ